MIVAVSAFDDFIVSGGAGGFPEKMLRTVITLSDSPVPIITGISNTLVLSIIMRAGNGGWGQKTV